MKYFDQAIREKEQEIVELKAQQELYEFAMQHELFYDEGRTYCEVKRGIYSNFTNRMSELIEYGVREEKDLEQLQQLIEKCKTAASGAAVDFNFVTELVSKMH